jgi:hypothetical protein
METAINTPEGIARSQNQKCLGSRSSTNFRAKDERECGEIAADQKPGPPGARLLRHGRRDPRLEDAAQTATPEENGEAVWTGFAKLRAGRTVRNRGIRSWRQ